MEMKRLFENWNKFRSDVIEEELINEASQRFVDHVEEYLYDVGGIEGLPFNDLFEGKARVVLPLGTAVNPDTPMAELLRWFSDQGYETDFSTGLATKEFESFTGNPNDPNTKKVMRKKQQKIGKVLQRASDLIAKIRAQRDELAAAREEFYDNEPPYTGGAHPDLRDDPKWSELDAKLEKLKDEYHKHFKHETYSDTIKRYNEFWNTESRYYRENPEEMMTDYSIIVTRHPIDVLNMSDLGDIESCHSEGSDYHCNAIKDAVSGGVIAYLVETSDLDEIDVDDDEIFADNRHGRGVKGINPLGRVRLRHFVKTGTFTSDRKYSLLLPEKREYSTPVPVYEAVREWAVESQKDKWSEALVHDIDAETDENPDPMKMDPDYLRDFVRKGGEYQDTNARAIFAAAFKNYGGEGFEHAAGGEWQDSQEEEERLAMGIEQYIEQMQTLAYDLDDRADRYDKVDEKKGLGPGAYPFIESFEWKVVNPQTFKDYGTIDGAPRWDQDTYDNTHNQDSYDAAESQNDPRYGPYPEVAFQATTVLRVRGNGERNMSEMNDEERQDVTDRVMSKIKSILARAARDHKVNEDYFNYDWQDPDKKEFKPGYDESDLDLIWDVDGAVLEEDDQEDIFIMRMWYAGITSGADQWSEDHRPSLDEHLQEFYMFVDHLNKAMEHLGDLDKAMRSVLEEDEWSRPSFTSTLQKDIKDERQSFSKFLLRMDNNGGYTLTYPMHGDTLLPDDMDKENEVVMQIPAGRMPTREILHAQYKDVRKTGSWKVPSYISPKFTRQVVSNMAKLFAQAHMSAKKQLSLPLSEQEEGGRDITVQDIQEYIADGFTLALADVSYEKGSGTTQAKRDFIPDTGVPIQTVLAIVRFVLDDDRGADMGGLSYEQSQELFRAGINFVKMLDEDISLLGKEVTGVLQTLSPQTEGGYADKGIAIKQFLDRISKMVTVLDNDIEAVILDWQKGEMSGNLPGIQRLKQHKELADKSESQRQYYRRQVGQVFAGTKMSQYIDDRLDLLDGYGRLARRISQIDHPSEWSKLTDELYKEFYDWIAQHEQNYKNLQTVEELSRLFESAPNLMKLIEMQVSKVISRR
jgi:hypothetical protein